MQITSQVGKNQQTLLNQLKGAQFQIQQIDDTINKHVFAGDISNNIKYLVSNGQDKKLKIFKLKTNKLFKSITFKDNIAGCCKFSNDSQLLYVGFFQKIFQFCVDDKFKKLCKFKLFGGQIANICFISSSKILTLQFHLCITKINVNQKQQLLTIQVENYTHGFDYNNKLDLIVSASQSKSIKLWNGNEGVLVIEKENAHESRTKQILFNVKNNQLISVDSLILIMWNINFQTSQLEQSLLIENAGYNISLVLDNQYIIALGNKSIKIYTSQGVMIRQYYHNCNENWISRLIQPDSMRAILMQGVYSSFVCKIAFQ